MNCPLTGCPIKKVLLAVIVSLIVTLAFDFAYHGTYMKPMYDATAAMWRTEAEMQSLFSYCFAYHGIFAFAIGGLYCFASKNAGCGGKSARFGITFGLFIGLAFGVSDLSVYMYLPFENWDIPIAWFVGRIIWGILLGLALSFSSRLCKTSCCAGKADCNKKEEA